MRRVASSIVAFAVALSLSALPAAAQSDAQRKQIEEAQKEVVKQIKPTLPRKLDEITTLTDIASSGVILAYTYSLDTAKLTTVPNVMALLQKNTTSQMCKTEAMANALKLGAVYQYIYVDLQSKPLGQFEVKSTDCA
jgi:hypothetical protein